MLRFFPVTPSTFRASTSTTFYSSQRHFSWLKVVNKILKWEPVSQNPPKITYLSKEELKTLCDRNFERQLQELSTKGKETVKNPSSSLHSPQK